MSSKQKALVVEALKRGAKQAFNRSHAQQAQPPRPPQQKAKGQKAQEGTTNQNESASTPTGATLVNFELDLGRYTGTASNMEQMRLANAAPLLITEARERTRTYNRLISRFSPPILPSTPSSRLSILMLHSVCRRG